MKSSALNTTPGRRVLATLAIALAGIGATTLAASTAVAADPPWGFEQVTPPVKGEGTVGAVDGFRPSPDGNAFLYTAKSPFSSVPTDSAPQYTRYIGVRGADAWHSRGMDPLLDTPAYIASFGVLASSADVSHVLVGSTRALTPGATEGGGNLYIRDTRTGAYTLVATNPNPLLSVAGNQPFGESGFVYVANDGRSTLFTSGVGLVPGAPDSDGGGLYSWTQSGGVKAESVLPADEGGAIVIGGSVGASEVGPRDPMPRDDHALDHVYFTPFVNSAFGGAYVRTGDVTRAVSVSRIPGDPSTPVPAQVDAVSAGGRYLTFHTLGLTPLTSDTQTTGLPSGGGAYVYRYDVIDDTLTYIAVGGADAVLQMTQDGQTIAFQSTAVLAPGATVDQVNMYIWHDGAVQYVETAEPGSTASSTGMFLRLLSPNGRYLAFTDNSPSTAQRFGFDNVSDSCPAAYSTGAGGCDQVYRFDVAADRLTCVSCRTDGQLPRGHSGDPWGVSGSANGFIRLDQRQAQTVTDDGTVFFTSPDDLLPAQDGNGLDDVYASHDGQLQLLSRGAQNRKSRFVDATPDGKSVFFSTDDPIVATDTDRAIDIYMTRQGAGFPYAAPIVAAPCTGSDCRDPAPAPAAAPPPASPGTDRTGASSANPKAASSPRAKLTVVRATLAGTRLRLTITTTDRGRIRVSDAGLRTATRTVTRAGTYTVSATLSPKSRSALRRHRRLAARARVSLTPPFGLAAVSTYRRTLRK